jgi:hypothetical protein
MKKTGLWLLMLAGSMGLQAADGLFPQMQGWKLKVEKMVYAPDNLWELINGAADLYLEYDFQDLHLASYSNTSDQEVKVELYRHSNPDNTYGIYTSERMPDYHFIETGIQGYTSPGILHFFTGHYYVKIISAGTREAEEETLKIFAGSVAASLNQTGSWPEELELFPAEGRVPMSDAYVATNFMGYGFFRSAFTMRYENGGSLTMFIIHGKPGEASAMLDKYKSLLKEDKVLLKDPLYIIQDMFNGTVFLSLKNDYLVGILNAENEEVAGDYIKKVLLKITPN